MAETDNRETCPCCHRPVDNGTPAGKLVRTWKRISMLFMFCGLGFAIVGVVISIFLEWIDPFYVLGTTGILLSGPFVVLWGKSRSSH